DGGSLFEGDLAREAGARLVGAQAPGDLDDVRRRRDRVEVELADLADVVENRGELAGHPSDLVLVEAQAGQARDVQDFLAVDHGAHCMASRPWVWRAAPGGRRRAAFRGRGP